MAIAGEGRPLPPLGGQSSLRAGRAQRTFTASEGAEKDLDICASISSAVLFQMSLVAVHSGVLALVRPGHQGTLSEIICAAVTRNMMAGTAFATVLQHETLELAASQLPQHHK